MKKTNRIGTIQGAFQGALDGICAQLISQGRFGYTVQLLASKGQFHQGDLLSLSPAEFLLEKENKPGYALAKAMT